MAVAVSLLSARQRPTLLVDLRGDGPTMLARDQPAVGLRQWLGASRPPPDALSRLELPVSDGLSVLPVGPITTTWPEPDRVALLAALLADDERQVVVDAGTSRGWRDQLVVASDLSIIVTRSCYLSIDRAGGDGMACDGVVLLREPGRLLGGREIGQAFGAPIVASLRWDPAVATAIDVGTIGVRLPRSLRALSRAMAQW